MTHDVSGVGTSPPAGTGMPTAGRTSSTGGVAGTAKDQAGEVAHEAKVQARNLANEAKASLSDRSTEQRDKAVGGLRSLSDELDRMASGQSGTSTGTSSEVVRQLSQKTRQASDFLEQREPGEILDEIREFARRRPGAFLAVAAGAGLLVGRLTRAAVDEAKDSSSDTHSMTGNGRVTGRMSAEPYGGMAADDLSMTGGGAGATLGAGTGTVGGGVTPQPLAEDVPRFDEPPTRPGQVP